MRKWFVFCLFICATQMNAQLIRTDKLKGKNTVSSQTTKSSVDGSINTNSNNSLVTKTGVSNDSVAPIDWYKIISYDNRITVVDTSLTIKKYQNFNYLGRDMFGLQQLSNDGQSYNVLDFSLIKNGFNPNFGFSAKQFNFYQIEDINYYKVPTPFTELSYRSAIKQGQNLNTLFTTNLNERLNLFIGYRGLRSLGAYINELNSIGNFKVGGSYNTSNEKYFLRANVVVQDITNQENGGITDVDLFESSETPYNNRERLNVYSRDAKSLFKGIRTFLDHKFRINNSKENAFWLKHQFYYDYKTNQFEQDQLTTYESDVLYYGNSFTSKINDKVRFKNVYNKLALSYQSNLLGELSFMVDYSAFEYYYNSVVLRQDSEMIPASINYNLATIGASYAFSKDRFNFSAQAKQSISNVSSNELSALFDYKINDDLEIDLKYEYLSKVPEMTAQMFQSSYVNYNWVNHFSNEKIQSLSAVLKNPYLNLSGNFQVLNDYIYFSNDNSQFNAYGIALQQLVTPKQYKGTIGYFNIKAQREFKFGKFALDNSLLFQQVTQDQNVLNVPSFVTRNTLYYSDYLFKKALFLQTGIVFNYHTKYYANEYNALLSEFYVQDSKKIGGFPTFDFFVNAKIRTARVYLSLEHFNARLTGYNYFATPTRPFHDMTLRFGIVWDFFN